MTEPCFLCDEEVPADKVYRGYDGMAGHRICIKALQDLMEWDDISAEQAKTRTLVADARR